MIFVVFRGVPGGDRCGCDDLLPGACAAMCLEAGASKRVFLMFALGVCSPT